MNIPKLLLHLYPRVWRARYEEEFLVVLTSRPCSFFEGIDVLRGALDAHLHPPLGTTGMSLYERMRQMFFTLRHSLLTIFCAYSGFLVAGIGFQKLTEDRAFVEAAQIHSFVGFSFHLVVIGAVAALLAVLIGGLPLIAAVVKEGFVRKRYSLLLLLAIPILALAAFIGTTFLLEALVPIGASPFPTLLARGVFSAVFLGSTAASTGAVCCAVALSEISERSLRFAMLPSLLITLAMMVMLVATLGWGLSLRSNVPQLFNSNNGVFGTSTSGAWLSIILVMSGATVLAAFSFARGLAARSALPTAVI